MTAKTEPKRLISQANKEGLRNPWVIGWIALVVIVVGVNAGMVATAFITNPGLVDKNYYESGQAMESAYLSRQAARTALGWQVALELPEKVSAGQPGMYRLRVNSKENLPLRDAEVRLNAYRPSDATADISAALKESAPGRYDGYLTLPLKGVWDLKVHVIRGEERWDLSRRVCLRDGVLTGECTDAGQRAEAS